VWWCGFSKRGSLLHCVERRDPFKTGTVNTDPGKVKDEYIYNGDFEVISGRRFFKNGEIEFEQHERIPFLHRHADNTHRTVFGPSISHSGVILRNNDHNQKYGFHRLSGIRFPERPFFHNFLFAAQQYADFPVHEKLCKKYAPYFAMFSTMYDEAEEHHDEPHVKRALRIQAWQEMLLDCTHLERLWLQKVLYKMKKDEIAKPGKVARMIGDLGVAASLQGFVLTKMMKKAQSQENIEYLGGLIQVVEKANPLVLDDVFQKLINPPGRYYGVIFSDDSCFSIRVKDRVLMYNVDIKKCDGSHGPRIFQKFIDLFPARLQDTASRLVEQCQLPIKVYSTGLKKQKVVLRPKRPMLYSGSTMTTVLNNLANVLIMASIAEADWNGPQTIQTAANNVGYVVDIQECEIPEDLQFLKNSPVWTACGWMAMLNLGVFLRASGVCRGDIPGTGTLEQRAREFQAALVQGAYPNTEMKFLNNVRKRAGTKTNQEAINQVAKLFEYKTEKVEDRTVMVTMENATRRYRLNGLELIELTDTVGMMDYRDHYNGSCVNKIMKIDYGLETLDL
jgi:hypothetical protein